MRFETAPPAINPNSTMPAVDDHPPYDGGHPAPGPFCSWHTPRAHERGRHFSFRFRIATDDRRVAWIAAPVFPTSEQFQEITIMQQKNHREPTILRRPQVQQRTGLSRSTLYQYIKDGEFPKSIALGPRSVGWLESDIIDWIAERVRISRSGDGQRAR